MRVSVFFTEASDSKEADVRLPFSCVIANRLQVTSRSFRKKKECLPHSANRMIIDFYLYSSL